MPVKEDVSHIKRERFHMTAQGWDVARKSNILIYMLPEEDNPNSI